MSLAVVPGPLFAPSALHSGRILTSTKAFDSMWLRAERKKVDLLVVDPAGRAYAGDMNDAAGVRAFMGAMDLRAEETGIATVVVAHDTKAARAGRGDLAGSGAISGSGQWFDAARAVLWMAQPAQELRPAKADLQAQKDWQHRDARRLQMFRTLVLVKSNYGPSGWRVDLGQRKLETGHWAGWEAQDG